MYLPYSFLSFNKPVSYLFEVKYIYLYQHHLFEAQHASLLQHIDLKIGKLLVK